VKPFHEFIHARQTTKTWNTLINHVDLAISLLRNEDLNGYFLNETFENLLSLINLNCSHVINKGGNIFKFLNGHDSYVLESYTDRSRYKVLQDKLISDEFGARFVQLVNRPQISNLTKLAAIEVPSDIAIASLTHAAPLLMEKDQQYALMMNDWLDAASYIFKNIDFNTGEPTAFSEQERRDKVTKMLGQFTPLEHFSYRQDLQDEVNLFIATKDYIISNISDDVTVLSAYIDSNVDKAPLIRRVWSLG